MRWTRSTAVRVTLVTMASGLATALALGQGALDAGLQVGSKANAAARQEDFRSRNLVVTGDVAAGRGFRGSVGYAAEGDFRAATGSDTSINFRRNTALSSPTLAQGSGGAGTSFAIGRDSVSSLEYRRDYVGAGSTGPAGASTSVDATRSRLDRLSASLTSSERQGIEAQSSPMVRYRGREGDEGTLTVSSVRGIKKERDRDRLAGDRLSLYEAARLREDLRNGLMTMDAVGPRSDNPFKTAAPQDSVNVSSTRDIRQPSRGELANQPVEGHASQYDNILKEIRTNWLSRAGKREGEAEPAQAATPAGGPEAKKVDDERLGDAYERLLRQLRGAKAGASDGAAKAGEKQGEDGKPSGQGDGKDGKAPEEQRRGGVNMTLDDYAVVLRHGTTLDAFGDGGRDRQDQLLAEGQRAMHEGNSFVAEKRFEVVLAMKPGDARATAGLLHCQIGANLPGSAAITLRALLTEHPEMMDVRYGAQAMPPQARLERTAAAVRERLKAGRDTSDYGLLLAYIGHLVGDTGAVQEGLGWVKGTPGDDTMRALLEKLWLAPDAKPAIEGATPLAPAAPPTPVP